MKVEASSTPLPFTHLVDSPHGPASDHDVQAAVSELNAWARDVAGRRRVAAMNLATQVRNALEQGAKELSMASTYRDLVGQLPASVLSLLRITAFAEPRTARREPGTRDSPRVEPQAKPSRMSRKRLREDANAVAQPPTRRRRTETRSDDLQGRASALLEALSGHSNLMWRFEINAVEFMAKKTPPILLGSLMHSLNEELPYGPWVALGELLALIRSRSDAEGGEWDPPSEVLELVTKAQKFCSDVYKVMSWKEACVTEAEQPAVVVAAVFSGLRGLTISGVMKVDQPSEDLQRDLYRQAIELVVGDKGACLQRGDARGIASCLNGMKEGLASGALDPNSAPVKDAFGVLLGLINDKSFIDPNSQSISNAMNGVTSALAMHVLSPGDERILAALNWLMALVLDRKVFVPNDQEHVNFLTGMRAAVKCQALSPGDATVKKVLTRLMEWLADLGNFNYPESQHLANVWHAVRVVLQHRALPRDDAILKAVLGRLVELTGNSSVFKNPSTQETANTLRGMGVALEMGALRADDVAVRNTFGRLVRLVRDERHFRRPDAQAIAACQEGVQAAMSAGVWPSDDADAKEAIERLKVLRAGANSSS